MSRWTHNICERCWNVKNPDRIPVKLKEGYRYLSKCCFCGKQNRDGIHVREDPKVPLHCDNGREHAD